ncbi:MAG: MerR family DNA-binding transcriptional regulator [Chloroflexi bacterium]|nr:MerR family DNA-binding transcriptional regulator [Chloroflexota bacterium]
MSQAAQELGVSVDTLRRWEAAGKIQSERMPSVEQLERYRFRVNGREVDYSQVVELP